MIANREEALAILSQYNPWWEGGRPADLPASRRAVYGEVRDWVINPPAPRAALLSGPRQVGKTTLLMQVIDTLLDQGAPPQNILYATFDHPLLKAMGVEKMVQLWRDHHLPAEGLEYLFLDEIQFVPDWQTWIKHQVDFRKDRRIVVTGSATPLVAEGQESGVGRWHTIRLATLSFYEFLQLRRVDTPELPEVPTLASLFQWSAADRRKTSAAAEPLVAHFHDYLLRGGFPQCALRPSIETAQRMLREDIVDKVLRRDMTFMFGVRRVVELEQLFLYLCLHDGGLLDMTALCRNLEVKRPTANNYLALLENTHLLYRLSPFGYGKEVLRAKHKAYLADAAIGPSVLLMGRRLLENEAALGRAVETALFKHVYSRYYRDSIGFSFWRAKTGHEVDIVAQVGMRPVPFEVKFRRASTGAGELKGIIEFCRERAIRRGYVITRDLRDFSTIPIDTVDGGALLKVPAALACYWLGQSELLDPTRHPDPGDD